MKLIFVLLLAGCGIKGPPLPPVTEETVQGEKLKEESLLSKPNTTSAPASADATPAKQRK